MPSEFYDPLEYWDRFYRDPPPPPKPRRCRFAEVGCPDEVVAIVAMAGCVCYPDDTIQALCLQHLHESEPLGHWESCALARIRNRR